MNKRQIISSLKNIANSLDNLGHYNEATNLTKVMIKIAQNEEMPNTFDEIYLYKSPIIYNNEHEKFSLDGIRKSAKMLASSFRQIKTQTQAKSFQEKIFDKLNNTIKYLMTYEGYKVSPFEDMMKQEANRLGRIISDYVDEHIEELSEVSEPTYTPPVKQPISKEEIQNVKLEYQQKLDDNPKDERSRMMVELCDRLLANTMDPMGMSIAEEKFKRRNPYWDPRD